MATKLVVDCSTGIVEEVALTAEEIAQREADATAAAEAKAQRLADEQAKAAAKQAAQDKLKALGLTDLEVAALVGA
jgi:membrane protein involved in colicin uptake